MLDPRSAFELSTCVVQVVELKLHVDGDSRVESVNVNLQLDIGNRADAHTAQHDRRAHVEAAHRRFEIRDADRPIPKEPTTSEDDGGCHHNNDGAQDKSADDGWVCLLAQWRCS